MRTISLLVAVSAGVCLLAAVPTQAQCPNSPGSLSTPFNHNNGQSGNMFDIVCTDPNNVVIDSFEVSLDASTFNMEVYFLTAGGSHVGNETNPAVWTLVGSAIGVVSNGLGVPTPLPIPINMVIANGTTQAFYVTSSSGTGINYTNGTAVGSVLVSDASIQILQGTGNAYPFTSVFMPRNWNGIVCYTSGGTPATQEFQVNTDAASLKVNNLNVNQFNPTVVSQNVEVSPTGTLINSANGNVVLSTNVASVFYDVLTNGSPVVPLSGAGFQIPVVNPTEIVNINVASGFSSLNSGLASNVTLVSFPASNFPGSTGGSFGIPYAIDASIAPITITLQGVVTNPGNPSGFGLTGATQMDIGLVVVYPVYSTCPSTVGGDLAPLSDDGFVNVVFSIPFTFYGVPYTNININMNGNGTFTLNDTDFSPTEAEFLSQEPRIAPAWEDWNPGGALQGTVRTYDDGVTFACEWFDVRHFLCPGGVGDTATFCMELTYATGQIDMSYGQFTSCNTLGALIAGISPGTGLSAPNNVDLWDATVPGPLNNGPTALPNDAIYEAFGLGVFGPFDLAGDAPGTPVGLLHVPAAGNGIAFLPTGVGPGTGPYIQN